METNYAAFGNDNGESTTGKNPTPNLRRHIFNIRKWPNDQMKLNENNNL